MTIEEAKEALEELKKEGETEEDILKTLYLMYVDGKMDLDDLRGFTELLGYKFTEEFEAMSDEDKKTKGLKRKDDGDGKQQSAEDIEKAKEFGDDADEKAAKAEPEDKKDDEEDDDAKAARLFGFKK